MARIKYYYNTETCKYERATITKTDFLINIAGFLTVCALFTLVFFLLYLNFFDSPKEIILRKENEALKQNYETVNKNLDNINRVLASLQDRDDNIYRIIFETSPIPSSIRHSGYGGVDKYKDYASLEFDKDALITHTFERIDQLKRQLYVQSVSYDEIMELAYSKEKMLSSIPAIQPIFNKHLKSLASGFGMRIHPIYKVKKFHSGVDFAAVRGTPVFATGDGVAKIPNRNDGYGNMIEIDHGFGFVTRYAHLDSYKIKNGQKVKRGEIIGYVGNTGTATSSHLHYEVLRYGKHVDPVYYFFNDLTPAEYNELIKIASVENQSLG